MLDLIEFIQKKYMSHVRFCYPHFGDECKLSEYKSICIMKIIRSMIMPEAINFQELPMNPMLKLAVWCSALSQWPRDLS